MNEPEVIHALSHWLVLAQHPVRILDAVRWTDEVRDQFFRANGTRMPEIDKDWYLSRPLGFDTTNVQNEFLVLETDIKKSLGAYHPAAAILLRMCGEYRTVIRMLDARGTSQFGPLSRELFGSSSDTIHPGEPTLADFGRKIQAALSRIEPCLNTHDPDDIANIPGTEAVTILQTRLAESMACLGLHPIVIADDGITADAAAGADHIKLRQNALFSRRELRLLEVHEGWVHVGTTLNGRAQSVCHFLGKGTPSSTVTQEGLAVLVEILSFSSSAARQQRINNRVLAVEMAENGADFLDVYRFFPEQGIEPSDSYQFTSRVFRGSTPDGSPFTKDIAYTNGFVMLYNFLRTAVNTGALEMIPLIFCGKTVLEDIGHLQQLHHQGLLQAPEFVPPQFADLHGLAAWMCYDDVLAGLSSAQLQSDFASRFRGMVSPLRIDSTGEV